MFSNVFLSVFYVLRYLHVGTATAARLCTFSVSVARVWNPDYSILRSIDIHDRLGGPVRMEAEQQHRGTAFEDQQRLVLTLY